MKRVFVKKTVCVLLSMLMCFSVFSSMAFSAGAIAEGFRLEAQDNVLTAFSISNPNASVVLTLHAPAKEIYGDGKTETATLDGLLEFNAMLNTNISEDDIVYYSYNNSQEPVALPGAPTDAGNYFASLSVSSGEDTYTISEDYTIGKATIPAGSYTAPTAVEGLVYNGEFQDLLHAGSATVGTMEYGYVDDVTGFTYIQSVPKGFNVGSYSIVYRVYGGVNYYSTPEQEIIVKIVADKTDLKAAIDDAQVFVDADENKNLATYDALNTALSAAKTVYNQEFALQTAVDSAAVTLNAALKAAQDDAAAAAVAAKIAAIGEVAYTDSSKALIDAAQSAYDALSEEQKALVENLQDLESAKSLFEQKKAAAIEEARTKLGKAIDAAEAFYNVIAKIPLLKSVAKALNEKIQQAKAILNDADATIEDLTSFATTLALALDTAEEEKDAAESAPAQTDDRLYNILFAVNELVKFLVFKFIPGIVKILN